EVLGRGRDELRERGSERFRELLVNHARESSLGGGLGAAPIIYYGPEIPLVRPPPAHAADFFPTRQVV
ncbi:MAG TPA: hypothetical protein VFO62_01005, partial [Candidatus Binatia bacterium]|nr:hypothetical protein [Candidatus Binatia bacterium]